MSRTSAKSEESPKTVKPVLPLETPRALTLVVAIMFVTIAAFVMMAGREPSPQATVALDVQSQRANAARNTARPRATTGAPATTRTASPTPAAKSTPPPRVVSTIAASATEVDAITVTGCLERDDDRFRLKDTDGENAPTARSWKGGFIRRTNRSVEVVDASNRFKLANHVGERVSATGTLVDGDMQLRSLRRVATSCEEA